MILKVFSLKILIFMQIKGRPMKIYFECTDIASGVFLPKIQDGRPMLGPMDTNDFTSQNTTDFTDLPIFSNAKNTVLRRLKKYKYLNEEIAHNTWEQKLATSRLHSEYTILGDFALRAYNKLITKHHVAKEVALLACITDTIMQDKALAAARR